MIHRSSSFTDSYGAHMPCVLRTQLLQSHHVNCTKLPQVAAEAAVPAEEKFYCPHSLLQLPNGEGEPRKSSQVSIMPGAFVCTLPFDMALRSDMWRSQANCQTTAGHIMW